jgi:prepilin-type N-terminal cleavage/methylation domain-containing protein
MRWRRRVRLLLQGQRGYSLIELLVVLVVMGIVMSSLTTVFISASSAELDMNNRFQAQLNARLAMDRVRREVHCASAVTLGSAGSPSGPLAATSVTITLPTGCPSNPTGATPSITWCTQGSGSRFGVYRVVGSSCSGGVKYADFLTKPNIFDYAAQTGNLAKVNIDLPVNVKPSRTVNAYELKDDIVLRNSSRP